MPSWNNLARKYEGQDIVVAVHLGYGRSNLDNKTSEESKFIEKMEFPIIEVVEGKRHLNGENVNEFPSEDSLKGYKFGQVYLCGAKREVCIPRMEACLKNNSEAIIRLERLIH